MKKRKIVQAFIVAFGITLLLGGCKKSEKKISQSKVIDWAIAGLWGFENEDSISEEKVTELNQLLAEKGKDYQIKFHVVVFEEGQLSEKSEEILRKCDLITIKDQMVITNKVKYYPTLLECEDKNMFEPLDQYMQTEDGMKIKEKMLTDLTLESGYWDGKQWMLPTELPALVGSSLMINKRLYEMSGVESDTVPDFTKCDDLFAKLFEANGKVPFLVLSDRKVSNEINYIPADMPAYLKYMLRGGDSLYQEDVLGTGSLMVSGSDLDTKNLLKEPYFEEYLNAWRRYIEKGYVSTDMDANTLVEMCGSYEPEMIDWDTHNEKWVIPKSENYILHLQKQPAVSSPCVGISAESKKKELAFEVLTDMITDKELNEAVKDFREELPSGFVFYNELSEEGEKEYLKLIESVPRFVQESSFETFHIPEMVELNKVYAEYSTEEDDDGAQKVLERHFSKDGKVTEESIHAGIQQLNEKLDAAGMERLIEALKEQKQKFKK